MKYWGIFLLIAVAVVQDALTQYLDVQLQGGTCHPLENTKSTPLGRDPILALRNGYTDFENSVRAAESIAVKGLTLAAELVTKDPQAAAETIRKYMKESSDKHYDGGLFFFFGIGEALSICNSAREKLSVSSLLLQYDALEILNEMGTATTLSIQGTELGGELGKQAIEAACLSVRAAFAKIYYQIPVSLEIAIESVSNLQNCHPGTGYTSNRNSVTNSVILASISKIEKAAEDAVQNKGASVSKVNWLKESVKISLANLDEIALQENSTFAYILELAKTDPLLAKNKYLTDTNDFVRRIHTIFANTFLDYAASAVNVDSSSMKEIGSAIRIMERANGDVILAEEISKHLALVGLESLNFEARMELLYAAQNMLSFKMRALGKGIEDSAIVILSVLK